jgi:hypothetical protein
MINVFSAEGAFNLLIGEVMLADLRNSSVEAIILFYFKYIKRHNPLSPVCQLVDTKDQVGQSNLLSR